MIMEQRSPDEEMVAVPPLDHDVDHLMSAAVRNQR